MRNQNLALALVLLTLLVPVLGLSATEEPEAPQVPAEEEACSLNAEKETARQAFGETIGTLVYEMNSLGGPNCECAPGGYPGCPAGESCVVSLCYANSQTPHIRGLCV